MAITIRLETHIRGEKQRREQLKRIPHDCMQSRLLDSFLLLILRSTSNPSLQFAERSLFCTKRCSSLKKVETQTQTRTLFFVLTVDVFRSNGTFSMELVWRSPEYNRVRNPNVQKIDNIDRPSWNGNQERLFIHYSKITNQCPS